MGKRERKIIKGGSLGLQGKRLAVWFPFFIGTGADMWVHPPHWMNESLCVGGAPELLHSLYRFLFHLVKKEIKYNSLFILIRVSLTNSSSRCTHGTNGVDWNPYIILTVWNLIPSAVVSNTFWKSWGLLRDLCLLAAEYNQNRNGLLKKRLSSHGWRRKQSRDFPSTEEMDLKMCYL